MIKEKIIIKEIVFNSEEYIKAVELRNRILRFPLGLKLDEKELLKENRDFHIGCFIEDHDLIGILILTPVNDDDIKMRQVAVENKYQKKGIGKMLVKYSEELSVKNGFCRIILNARITALEFYLTLGYKIISDEYIDEDTKLPHCKMEKNIM
jgi:predicted GNAT family N-acyltransferase